MADPKVLVVGCGTRPRAGAVNLDRVKLPGVDVVFDLDKIATFDLDATPRFFGVYLPFGSNVFDLIEAEDVIEHVNDPITVVQELGRVLKVGGTLWIRGPDGRYPEIVWADLTHKRAFAPRSFDGFDPETHDGKLYGHYHGPIKFKRGSIVERNKGLEFTLVKRG